MRFHTTLLDHTDLTPGDKRNDGQVRERCLVKTAVTSLTIKANLVQAKSNRDRKREGRYSGPSRSLCQNEVCIWRFQRFPKAPFIRDWRTESTSAILMGQNSQNSISPVKIIGNARRNSAATKDSALEIIPEAERTHPAIAMNNNRSCQDIFHTHRCNYNFSSRFHKTFRGPSFRGSTSRLRSAAKLRACCSANQPALHKYLGCHLILSKPRKKLESLPRHVS
jgi:hypothetical protein